MWVRVTLSDLDEKDPPGRDPRTPNHRPGGLLTRVPGPRVVFWGLAPSGVLVKGPTCPPSGTCHVRPETLVATTGRGLVTPTPPLRRLT